MTDLPEKRLRRYNSKKLRDLAFSVGLNATHGFRHRNYHCSKVMLIDALVGRPVDWSEVDRHNRKDAEKGKGGQDEKVESVTPPTLPAIDMDVVEELVKKIVDEKSATLITIEKKKGAKTKKITNVQHYLFERLLKLIGMGENIWLVGPAGSGKTQAARNVAKALDLPFASIAGNMQLPVSKLLGFENANGKYVSTDFHKAVENGGVFLFDEADNTSANALCTFNDILAAGPGDLVSFPDKMVKKHSDFVGIAAANTVGKGADRIYVGRCQIDGATLDRFLFMDWDYDEALERTLALGINKKSGEWVDRVQALRHAALAVNIRHIISPRASMKGAQMLGAGFSVQEAEDMAIWKGLQASQIEKIKSHAGLALTR